MILCTKASFYCLALLTIVCNAIHSDSVDAASISHAYRSTVLTNLAAITAPSRTAAEGTDGRSDSESGIVLVTEVDQPSVISALPESYLGDAHDDVLGPPCSLLDVPLAGPDINALADDSEGMNFDTNTNAPTTSALTLCLFAVWILTVFTGVFTIWRLRQDRAMPRINITRPDVRNYKYTRTVHSRPLPVRPRRERQEAIED